MIATPAAGVPQVIRECIAAGVKGAIIVSAGFKEIGAVGEALEQQVMAQARLGGCALLAQIASA